MKQFLYLIGIPGSGKSTLMQACTAGLPVVGTLTKPFGMTVYDGGVQLGLTRPHFSGTDALSLSVQKAAMEWAANTTEQVAVAEGDRLANIGFWNALEAAEWLLTVVYLKTSPAVAAARRAGRGSEQDAAWIQGRATKVENLVVEWSKAHRIVTLLGDAPLEQLRAELLKHPVWSMLAREGVRV